MDENTPETALQVLTLFNPTKEGIANFSNQVIREVKEGHTDPLKIKIFLKTLEAIAEQIDKNTKPEQLREASKYGDKEFIFMGAKIQVGSVRTEYDYKHCADQYLEDLEAEAERLEQKIKARKELLRTLGEPTPMGSPDTGEIYTVYPPIKKTTEGIKVTIC